MKKVIDLNEALPLKILKDIQKNPLFKELQSIDELSALTIALDILQGKLYEIEAQLHDSTSSSLLEIKSLQYEYTILGMCQSSLESILHLWHVK